MASLGAAAVLRLMLIRSSSRAAVCQQQHRHLSSSTSAWPPVCYEDDQHNIAAASIPSAVWECLHQLRAAGHEVLLVGGAVRDLLLQCGQPKDYDLLTSAQLKQVKELFKKPRIIGKNFPICQLDMGGIKIEISSMHTRPARWWSTAATPGGSSSSSSCWIPADIAEHLLGADAAPGRGRRSSILPHMRQPQPSSWAAARRHNATARDFSVNALLYDPFQGVLFDYVGGWRDVQDKLLRCVGDPGRRFVADPACLLRAVRCAARAGLQIEPATAAAIQQHAHLVKSINPQRLTAELIAMLGYGAAAAALALLQQLQLMQHLLPLHYMYSSRVWQQDNSGTSSSNSSSSSSSSKQQQQNARRDTAAAMQPTLDTAAAATAAAGSQLGQFLLQTPGALSQGPLRSTSKQQEEGGAFSRHDQQHNLLLKVAAALDQHVSVKQPAQAEVLLGCLTAPLLVERLHKAVQQLAHQHVQQQLQDQQHVAIHSLQDEGIWQQQQHEQHVPDAAELFASQVLLQQQVQQQLQLQCQSESSCKQRIHSMRSATAGAWQQVQIASTARAFSSSGGSCSSSTQLPGAVQSCPSTAAVALELLNGASFGDVLHRQAVQLASEVCTLQQSSHEGSTLFGVSTPRLAADLLATHITVCREHRMQQQQQETTLLAARHERGAGSQQQQQQQRGLLAVGKSLDSSRTNGNAAGSTAGHRQYTSDSKWLDFDSHMPPPRTNKQYRRWMQVQQRQAAAEMAGSFGSIPCPDAMLLAAAFAGNSSSSSLDAGSSDAGDICHSSATAAGGSRARRQQQFRQCAAVVHGVELSHEEYVLHQVLVTACAGFDALEQQVAELQACLAESSSQVNR